MFTRPLCHKGLGIEKNFQYAMKFYKKACTGNNATSCYNIGTLFYNGEGVKKNKNLAKKFFSMACDEGDSDGCKKVKNIELIYR